MDDRVISVCDKLPYGNYFVVGSEKDAAAAWEMMKAVDQHNAPPAVTERFDVLPYGGLLRAARAMGHGMEQGYETEDGEYCHWKAQPASYHLNRALRHLALWKTGDTSEDHLDHIVSRILMWGALVE